MLTGIYRAFNWVNGMMGNVKNSLRGTCNTPGAKHLLRHLASGLIIVLISRACWLNWSMR